MYLFCSYNKVRVSAGVAVLVLVFSFGLFFPFSTAPVNVIPF
jgi:hypothetical protein